MMFNGQCYTSFPAPPQGLPQMPSPRKKKLTHEEEEQCLQRLTAKRPRRTTLEPLSPTRKIDPKQIQCATERLYTQEMRRRQEREVAMHKTLSARAPRAVVIEPAQLTESVERLFKAGQQHLKDLDAKLHQKYNRRPPPRSLSSEKSRGFTERFYSSRKEAKRDNIEKLVQKYVYDLDPPKHKVTKAQQAETISRLAK